MIQISENDDTMPGGDNDITLVLQDRAIDSDGQLRYISSMHDTMAGFVGDTHVTNGRADFETEVRPEPYRIRLLNGATSRTQFVSWSNGNDIHFVATDGHQLPETVTVGGVVLTLAQRSDLWVDFSQFPAGQVVLSTRRAAHWVNGTQWVNCTQREGRVVTELETVEANAVELWEFLNQSPIAHLMHLHGDAFRIVSLIGQRRPR